MATDITYTEQELEQAKVFLRDRMRNEQSMSADIERLLIAYAGYLLSALYRNASDDELEGLVLDLVAQIMADVELLAVDEHDRRDAILLYMMGERNGDTLEGRIGHRCHTFFNEVFAVYAAGKLLKLDEGSLLSSIKANMKHPWQNEVLVAVREKIERGEVTGNIEDFEEPHFGRGVEISSMGALQTMTAYAIGDAWMWWGHEDALSRGAKGYFVVRGSSYPCDICNEAAAFFHPIDDTEHIVPLHMNCVCCIVYSYVERV